MNVREIYSRTEINIPEMFARFLPIAMSVLKISKLPKIQLEKHVKDDEQPTFGRYVNDDVVIHLGIADRHPVDILRTLAHELVHFKQHTQGLLGPHSGDTGSPEENQAHEVAGVIMRHFNKTYPEYLDSKPLMFEHKKGIKAKKYNKKPQKYIEPIKPIKPIASDKVDENFADGKNPERKGLAKRSGVNCKASISTLRNVAKNSSGEKQRMAHWCANMKSGRKK